MSSQTVRVLLVYCHKDGPSTSAARPRTYRFLCTNLDGVNTAVRTSDLNTDGNTKLINPSVSVSVHRMAVNELKVKVKVKFSL